jgi:hypothetical protein
MTESSKTNEEPKKKRKRPDMPIVAIKTTVDYQRMKLERLMAKPDKVLNIPIRPKDKNIAPPPEFVRNIMGSSAGAGSGEFHVYRHLRRKEYTRQKYIQEKARLEEMHKEHEDKMEAKRRAIEEKTAKKRAKRLKKKQKRSKKKPGQKREESKGESSESSSSSSDEGPENPEKNPETMGKVPEAENEAKGSGIVGKDLENAGKDSGNPENASEIPAKDLETAGRTN